jgi:general secretion pathway protein D
LGSDGLTRVEGDGFVNFTFDGVDVRSFVKSVGEMTGRMFVVDQEVSGKITVLAPRIGREDIYALFVTILESVGCTVVQDDSAGVYRIVPLKERDVPVAPVIAADQVTPMSGLITKVIRLDHVTAREIHKMLVSKVGGGKSGAIAAIEETNHLVITDTASSVRRIEKIVKEIDQPGEERITRVLPLQHADAEEITVQLKSALDRRESRAERLKRRLPSVGQDKPGMPEATIVPSPRSNSLVLTGTREQLDRLKNIVERMDVESETRGGRLNAIFLKYISADEAAESIGSLLEKAAGKAQEGGSDRISVEPSVANNALLVDASPREFQAVQALVSQLDRLPEQVHIEVVILELTGREDFTLGVEMAALDQPDGIDDTVIVGSSVTRESAETLLQAVQQGVFPKGMTIGVASGVGVDEEGNLTAGYPGIINVEAMDENVKIEVRSQTSLEAQNNKEASVSIVNDIPVLKSTIEGGSGTARDVIQNIERMEVGIELELVPHVIDGDEVRIVLNPSIETVVDSGPSGTQFTPTIARREVSTTVTVNDGDTIVIAGLTQEDKNEKIRKVPILGSVPLLGMLFTRREEVSEKTDILILVKPEIVTAKGSSDKLIRKWEDRTGIKSRLERRSSDGDGNDRESRNRE